VHVPRSAGRLWSARRSGGGERRKPLVTLSGQLEWHFQRAAAETIVRDLAGVAGVSNEITLRARPQTTNLKSHIERALRRSADLDARFIRVKVVDGLVTLEGRGGVVARPGTRQRRGVDGTGRERRSVTY